MRQLLDMLCQYVSVRNHGRSRTSNSPAEHRRLRAEPLEQRTLLSVGTGLDPITEGAVAALAAGENTAPTLWIRGARTIATGADLSISDVGVFSDPDSGHSSFTATIDWGDGTTADTIPCQIDVAGAEGELTWGTFDGSHAFAAVGSYEASFSVTDDQGGQSIVRTMTIDVIESVPQDLVLESVAAIDEGQIATLRGSFVDTDSTKTHTVTVSWGDGTPKTEMALILGARSFELTHSYEDDGPNPGGTSPPSEVYNYPVQVTVTDGSNNSIGVQTSAVVNNVAPQLTVIGSQQFQEGWTFDGELGSFTDQGVLDTHTATINWGDGTTTVGTIDSETGVVSGTHTFLDENRDASDNEVPYSVTVTVADDDGGTGTGNISMLITNVAPILDPIADQTVNEGQLVTFGPTAFTDPGTTDTHTATVDWGDGTTTNGTVDQNANTVTGSHTFADNGVYTVVVTLADNGGGEHVQNFQVTVTNVVPTLTVVSDRVTKTSSTLAITNIGTFSDPGFDNPDATPATVETFTYQVNWGDGTSVDTGTATVDVAGSAGTLTQGSFDGSHVYTTSGEYTVSVTVIDDDGGQDTESFLVTVDETAPTLTLNVPSDLNMNEGETFAWPDLATFTHSNSGAQRQYNYTINWGDGGSSTGVVTDLTDNGGIWEGHFGGGHTYADNGTYTVSVRLDVDGTPAFDQESFNVVVANVTPTLAGITDHTATAGSPLNLVSLAQVLDPGYDNPQGNPATKETFTYRLTWGDATPAETGSVPVDVVGSPGVDTQGTLSGSHTYQAASTGAGYEVTLTVADDDGAIVVGTFLVQVSEAQVAAQTVFIGPLTETEFLVRSPSVLLSKASTTTSESVPVGPLTETEFVARSMSFQASALAAADSGNAPPILGTVGNRTLDEGQLNIVSIGAFLDYDSQGPFSYSIDWGDGGAAQTGTATITGSGPPTSGTFNGSRLLDNDVYTVVFTLADEQGNSVSESVFFTIENVAPTADAGGPYEVDENGAVQLQGSGYDPAGDLDPLTFEWDLDDDGVYGETGTDAERGQENVQNPIFSAAGLSGPQSWPVRMRVRDDEGAVSAIETTSVEILNVAPTLQNLKAVTPIDEGTQTTVSGTLRDPSEGDVLQLEIDWGDGSPVDVFTGLVPGSAFSYEHTYADDGLTPGGAPSYDYELSVVVSDDSGGSNTYPLDVRVDNLPPTILTLVETGPVNEGDEITLRGTIENPGVLDSHVVTIDWGDGNEENINLAVGVLDFEVAHYYQDDGPTPGGTVPPSASYDYTIEVTLEDDDTGTATKSITATVDNVAPTLADLAAVDINENEITTLRGEIVDPGLLDTFVLSLNWNDQTAVQSIPLGTEPVDVDGITWDPETRQFSVEHQYLDDGLTPGGSPRFDYQVDVTVTDDDTGSIDSTTTVRVTNVAPTVAILGAPSGTPFEGTPISLSAKVTDPGTLDTFTYSWSVTRGGLPYDDGSGGATNQTEFSFTPNDDGEYRVTVHVTDDDTGSQDATANITVVNAPPVAEDEYYQFDGIGVFEVAAPGVLGNDHDPGQDYPLRAVNFSSLICTGSGSDCGTLTANEDGSFSYEPVEDFSGTVAFTYYAQDQDGAISENPATVTIDVGMNSTISGYVYAANEDSRFVPDRLPLPGVFVTLEATDDRGVVNITALTDDEGFYEFTRLRAGTFRITERQPAACLDGGQHEQTVTIRVNEDNTGNDFAESWLRPQQISIGSLLASNLNPSAGDSSWPTDIRERMALAEEQAGNDYEAAVIRQGSMVQFARRGALLSVTGTDLSERFVVEAGTTAQTVTVLSNGFERTYETAVDEVFTLTIEGGGGHDEAVLHDSTQSDLLEGRYNLARLINDRFLVDLIDFDRLRAISSSGGNDRTNMETTVDYLLTLEGPWDDGV